MNPALVFVGKAEFAIDNEVFHCIFISGRPSQDLKISFIPCQVGETDFLVFLKEFFM